MINFLFGNRKRLVSIVAVVLAAIIVGWLAEAFPAAEIDGPLFAIGTLAVGAAGLLAAYAAIRLRLAFAEARRIWGALTEFEARRTQAAEEARALRYDLDLARVENAALRDRLALAERRLAKLAIHLDTPEDLQNP